jgi:ABC-type lipoprotein release transport system permease subunit
MRQSPGSRRIAAVFAAAAVALLLIAVAASVVPEFRALRIQPATALKYE